jgi:proton-translocating NADH-quinone oxidoreductase chain N
MPDLKAYDVTEATTLLPEIVLTVGLAVVLLYDMFTKRRSAVVLGALTFLAFVAAGIALAWLHGANNRPTSVDGTITSLVVTDAYGTFFRAFFLISGALTALMTMRSGESFRRRGEFHVLLLGAVIAMGALATARDMVVAYLAFETVSICGYLMVGFRKDTRGSEAATKYVIFGATSSAIMLYGLTLLFGQSGSTEFSAAARLFTGGDVEVVSLIALFMVFCGMAFRAPDAYDGAPAPVAGFLAVASKAAGFALIGRVLLELGATAAPAGGLLPSAEALPANIAAWLAVASMTVGNLAALRQSNLKRMLAWSSIAHAGYLLMAIAMMNHAGLAALLFYLAVYMFMTMGSFFLAAVLERETGSGEMESYRGIAFRQPWVAVPMAIMMIGLTGLPPTGGFIGKFEIFAAVFQKEYYVFGVIGLINGAISLYYYLRVVRAMFLETADETTANPALAIGDRVLLAITTVPVIWFGIFPERLTNIAEQAAAALR